MSPLTRGWVVAFSGLGINLALGVLYAWSVFAAALTAAADKGGQHLWTTQQANWPYSVALGSFALTMVFAGRLQDRAGPRWVATAGGVLFGLGMMVASLSPARLASESAFPLRMVLGFGVLGGVGIGLAYASATPAAVKWFSAGRRGLVTGIVVCGFGFAPLYAVPLTSWLIGAFGVNESFLFLGVVFFAVIVGLAQLVSDPPEGYVPPGSYREEPPSAAPKPAAHEYGWRDMVRTRSFYVLWTMFACTTFAGLMVIGIMARVADVQLGGTAVAGYTLVAAIALGNGLGRPVAGFVSDRLGRQHTMLAVFVLQAALMVGVRFVASAPLLLAFACFIGLCYGTTLALVPATTFDFFGTKSAGADYGLVFTAWGLGGVLGTQAAAWLFERSWTVSSTGSGTYAPAFAIAAALSLVAGALTIVLRAPDPNGEHCPVVDAGTTRQA